MLREFWIFIEMAKKNISDLLDRVIKESKDQSIVRNALNKKVHIYSLDYRNLVKEVKEQIEGDFAKAGRARVSLNPEQINVIKRACLRYFVDLKTSLVSSRGFTISFTKSSALSFEVRIESVQGGDVFTNYIASKRKKPLEVLRNELFANLKIDNADIEERIFGSFNPSLGRRTGGLLQIGHRVGSSIAEQRTKSYLDTLELFSRRSVKKVNGTSPYIDILIEVNNNRKLSELKNIELNIIYVSEQGAESNRVQGIQEKILVNTLQGKLQKLLRNTEWVNFKTSPSAIEDIRSKIFETAQKSGAKVAYKKPNDSNKKSSTKVKERIKGNVTTTRESDTLDIKASTRVDKRKQNWSSILGILNSKLPDAVMKNMTSPRLVNRTGRFAQSAKVVNIEQTPQGFPSIVFDYERDPYDVFDRSLGRAPWNTPQRDPRALVDQSVREIVREMAIGRFFTRRA